MILQATDISFSYIKESSLLKSVSLEIKAGDFLGILGRNGSGKTTLLKILSGYLKPLAGNIKLQGKDLHMYTVKDLAKLRAYAPQASHLEFDFTVEEVVAMGRVPYAGTSASAKDKEQIDRAIAEYDLQEFRGRNVRTLSGGEWQRVVLARVLAQDTEIIFLDEPTHFLDIKHQLELLTGLEKLKKQGKTIVAVLHDLHLARRFCSNVIMLQADQQSISGGTAELLSTQKIMDTYNVNSEVAEFFSK